MIRRPPRSTLFPYRRSSDLSFLVLDLPAASWWSACPGEGKRSEEHTSELQSPQNLVCRLLLEKKNTAGWERLKLHYRVLAGVGSRDLSTTLLGQPVFFFKASAPPGFHRFSPTRGSPA